jgi:hypothetical protein
MREKLLALAIAAVVSPLAVLAAPPAKVLSELPSSATWSLSPMFMANAIGQTGLNGQRDTSPDKLLNQLRQSLEKAGYSEQPIRTTVGAWGFSATWATPDGVKIDGTNSGQQAVLVTQATAIAPGKVNLNIRFDGVAPMQTQGSQTKETQESQPSTNININIPSPRRFF